MGLGKPLVHVCVLSRFSLVQLLVTLWTVAHQAALSMGFSRQENCSGLPCPPPGDRPNPVIEPTSLMSYALTGVFFTTSVTREVQIFCNMKINAPSGFWQRMKINARI